MVIKKVATTLAVVAMVTVLGVTAVGTALAQTDTPAVQTTPEATTQDDAVRPEADDLRLGRGLRLREGSASFDVVAEQLGLTPAELTEALDDGQTLAEIAEAQGVDLQDIQDALSASRIEQMKEKIAQAVTDGDMTQEEADWWLTGIDNGWVGGGRDGLGLKGFGGRHGGDRGKMPNEAPATSSSF